MAEPGVAGGHLFDSLKHCAATRYTFLNGSSVCVEYTRELAQLSR